MDTHPHTPATGRTTRRTTLGGLPEPLRSQLLERLTDDLFEPDPAWQVWHTESVAPAVRRNRWTRWFSSPPPPGGVVSTAVLADGGQLLIAVSSEGGVTVLRGTLAGLDTRPVVHPALGEGSPYDVTVNGLGTGPERSSYVVRTGGPDGLGLRAWLEDAVRTARARTGPGTAP